LEQLGADIIGVDVDDDGIVPASLEAALAHDPVALFTQPRAHNPLGVGTSMKRTAVLARLLRTSAVTIVEDDHAGDIAAASLVSMGRHLPDRTILVRSFSKSHGPDLRLSAVGGSGADARFEYARRRAAVSDALTERGVPFSGTDGINLWVDVDDERTAQLGLAARGIGVAPGSPFLVASDDRHHLRITVGLVRDGASQLADHVADAASTSRRHRHSVAR
jgi:DNA-binding transcriptional MocR family regulator